MCRYRYPYFFIGHHVVCKKDFNILKSGKNYLVSDVTYNNEELSSGLILIQNVGWFSFDLFESVNEHRVNKINIILDGIQ